MEDDIMASYQKVCIVDNAYDANAKAYLVDDRSEASVIGSVVDSGYDADMKVYLVEDQYDANIKLWLDEKNNSGCFITTACIETKALQDDCYELTTLRDFRDNYLLNTLGGRAIIEEYYKVAPKIIYRINQSVNKGSIYASLYENLVAKSVNYIENNEEEKAKANYIRIVNELKDKYLD